MLKLRYVDSKIIVSILITTEKGRNKISKAELTSLELKAIKIIEVAIQNNDFTEVIGFADIDNEHRLTIIKKIRKRLRELENDIDISPSSIDDYFRKNIKKYYYFTRMTFPQNKLGNKEAIKDISKAFDNFTEFENSSETKDDNLKKAWIILMTPRNPTYLSPEETQFLNNSLELFKKGERLARKHLHLLLFVNEREKIEDSKGNNNNKFENKVNQFVITSETTIEEAIQFAIDVNSELYILKNQLENKKLLYNKITEINNNIELYNNIRNNINKFIIPETIEEVNSLLILLNNKLTLLRKQLFDKNLSNDQRTIIYNKMKIYNKIRVDTEATLVSLKKSTRPKTQRYRKEFTDDFIILNTVYTRE